MIITETGTLVPETAADKYACGTLAYACAVSPQWPASVRAHSKLHASALKDALEDYEAVERGEIRESLEQAAEVIAGLTAELVAVFPACEVKNEEERAA